MGPNAELILHRRVADELEGNASNRDWWLSMAHWLEDEDTDPGLEGIGAQVEQWLATMNPDANVSRSVEAKFDGAGIIGPRQPARPLPKRGFR